MPNDKEENAGGTSEPAVKPLLRLLNAEGVPSTLDKVSEWGQWGTKGG